MRSTALLPAAVLVAATSTAVAQDRCTPASNEPTAAAWLERAAAATGLSRMNGRILHYRAMQNAEQNFQSDRTYPPFFSAYASQEIWFDGASGTERVRSENVYPRSGPARGPETVYTPRSSWLVRDTVFQPIEALHRLGTYQRALNPLAVIGDWQRDGSAKVEGRCIYRDFPRVALRRPDGSRLFIDPKTAIPVKLETRERHFLWGTVLAEYLWSTWTLVDGITVPTSSFRLADGAIEISRTMGQAALVSADGTPKLSVPDPQLAMDASVVPMFLRPDRPDTVRVGPNTFLLVNRGYTQAVTLARDTVFVFDATQGEERARQDSVWIGALFPGRHPIVVVVTDLAWPHIAGVRFWVANGATVVSHQSFRPFLEQVVSRRWPEPDALEQRRRPMRFRPVTDSLTLAGGAVRLFAINGIGSEGALMGWVPDDRFLWAGDFIQDADAPSQYLNEVKAAVGRVGIAPTRTAAQHLPLTEWAKLEQLR